MDEEQRRLAEELLFSEQKKASFAKKLFFGVYEGKKVFPFPRVDAAEKQRVKKLLEEVKDFVTNRLDPIEIDRKGHIPESVIEELGKLGLMGLTIPKQYGGLGMSQYAYCKVLEKIAHHCASTALLINAHQSIGIRALLLFGTEEQRQKWLPPLARGEFLAAFSLTEKNAGSDASGVESKAVYDPSRDIYILNGRKQWTTNGSIAKVLTVMAQTEVDTPNGKQNKITAFLVTPDMPGFNILDAALDKVGMRGTKTANLQFTDLQVPAANILGPKGSGLRVCLTCLDFGRTAFGATCTGAAKELLERAISHARTRHQFKRPLASFPLVKEKIALISALTYAMDATTYLTAGLIDNKHEDFMLEAAMLKVFASDSLWTIIYESMQIMGGRSFFTDEPFERMMRDARLNMIGEGSNEVMRAFIGVVGMRDVGMQLQGLLDASKNPFANFGILSAFVQQALTRLRTPIIPANSSALQNECRQLGACVRKFGFAIWKALAHYREDIIEQQLTLNRIATSAIAIYTTTAVLSKIDTILSSSKVPSPTLPKELATAKYYCHYAMRQANHCLDNLIQKENDKETESLSDLITGYKGSIN